METEHNFENSMDMENNVRSIKKAINKTGNIKRAAQMNRTEKKKMIKFLFCIVCCISLLQPAFCATPVFAAEEESAVTFSELNEETVFLKQSRERVCTLTSSAMMIRRAAMLLGNKDWRQITEQSIRKSAWAEGTGLKWNFTISGITVVHKSLTSKNELIKLLDNHPEGVVIYNTKKPHAILVTDYTDGIFYCSDPSNDRPAGRYPIEKASITVESASRCWYVKKPLNVTVIKDEIKEENDSTDTSVTYEVDNLTYQILSTNEKTAICTGCTQDCSEVTIPNYVTINKEEYYVVQIAESAFADSAALKKITIGANIVSIEPKAFYQCSKLKSVIIQASNLRSIGAEAFAQIHKKAKIMVIADQVETFTTLLTGASIPSTVTVGSDQSIDAEKKDSKIAKIMKIKE